MVDTLEVNITEGDGVIFLRKLGITVRLRLRDPMALLED